MFHYDENELLDAFENAKNINASLKKFIKSDLANDPRASRFFKDLRALLVSKDRERKLAFIAPKLSQFGKHFLALGLYAYPQESSVIADNVTEKFADRFNATYQEEGDGINVTDSGSFEQIAKQAKGEIERGLSEAGLKSNGFMLNVMFYRIFDEKVLPHVWSIVADSR